MLPTERDKFVSKPPIKKTEYEKQLEKDMKDVKKFLRRRKHLRPTTPNIYYDSSDVQPLQNRRKSCEI